jgi:hypothetical protein
MKQFFLSLLFIFSGTIVFSQSIDSFTVNTNKFLSELDPFLTASGSSSMKEVFSAFQKKYKSGVFTAEEQTRMIEVSNMMLQQKMTARPYFEAYLKGLIVVNQAENGAERFTQWHDILENMIADIQNRKLKPYLNFLNFSAPFFEKNALRASSRGVSWYGISDKPNMKYENKQAVIEYEKVDIEAIRKNDTIRIEDTKGIYYASDGIWKGLGGKVSWEDRFGLEDVYAELDSVEIEFKSSLYRATNVKMNYPLFFGQTAVVGKFEDKVVSSNAATEGSYPRFTSDAEIINIENIGEGIDYRGGFRLQGTTVYGYGSKENPARITIDKEGEERVFQGYSELFTIRRGERIVAERVNSTVYFGQDSLYHPSVNMRFEIPDKALKLSRGKRGSDRNPFYSSMHKVNIESDKINYYVTRDSLIIGEKSLAIKKSPTPAIFESTKFFNDADYRRVQNISTTNPIAIMRAVAEREGNIMSAHDLAKKLNSRYEIENIKSLLYDLVAKGFINYDADDEMVEIKDKVFHYANASIKKVDYDALQLISDTRETNGTFDLKTKQLEVSGVEKVEFSEYQKTALTPFKKTIYLKENRNMDFDGKLYSGYSVYEGKDFHFDYDNFSITLDSVRYFDLFIPTGVEDEKGNKEALSLASRIEHLSGVLLIDAPENKSGREEIPIFPSIQSKAPSFVFYDNKDTQKGVYKRDSFFFELKPFSFNGLDNLTAGSVNFDGNLVSFDIFPDIKETLVVREEDQSLGFETEIDLPAYKNAGNFKGTADLSNSGLQGKGLLTYLDAEINSEDLVFRPQNTTGSAEKFNLEEKRNATPEIPQVRGINVDILWRPYKDSLFVTAEEAPFEMFKDGQHTLRGTTILTPDGLKGNGLFDWPKASMTSNTFSFGAFSTIADTSDLKIRAFDADDLALVTDNLNAVVDFDKQIGNFKANDELLTTSLPYNQYETSFNEFDWDIKGEIITFKAEEGKKGGFLSVHPDQDSLRFQGAAASYNLKTSTLNISGVDDIISADAFIYPDSGLVDVIKGGKMTLLKNARIEADTINRYHVINRAEVEILGKKEFRAEGFYEYNIGDVEQEIRFDEITGTRIGKGSRAEKATATRATGEVSSEKDFLIDHKTLYRGTISLFSETPNLKFEGYARMKSTSLRRLHWFTVSFDGDKSDLKIKYDVPKNYQAEPLRTGLYLSKENNRVYSNIMAPLYFRKDRPILPVTGYMDYDKTRDVYIFGDSLKILQDGLKGNKLTYYELTGEVKSEGKYNIGSGLKYVSVQAAGRANAEAMPTDTSSVVIPKVTGDFMMALDLLLPDDLKKLLIQDFQGASFDAQPINYSDGKLYYQKAASELFSEKDTEKILSSLNQGIFDIPKKSNKSNLLFSKVPMQWDPDYQSFVSSKSTLSLASIDGQMINKDITAYIEVKMPQRGDDRLYVYLKSPSNLYYFFGFKEGIMNIVSDNPKFNDFVVNMKEKNRIQKMPDGETFEIQPVNPGTARQFVSRVKATW